MVSIVIPSYNSAYTIEQCLHALMHQSYSGEYEIILVDSSDDQTVDIVQEKFKNVIYYHFKQKTDPGTARNKGIKLSHGDPILFIDSDCIAAPDWIEKMVISHNSGTYAAVGGSVLNGNDAQNCVAWAGYMAEFREFIPEQLKREVDHIPTCNISYKRKVFANDSFNPKYYPQEDLDFNYRLRERGENILFNPEIKIFHHHRELLMQFLSHQKIIGKITAKLVLQKQLKGYRIFKWSVLTFFLLPFVAATKFMNTILVFLKRNRKVLTNHPLSVIIFALGLFPWMKGFFAGTLSKN